MEDVSTTREPTLTKNETTINTSKYFKEFKTPMFANFEFQIILDSRLNNTDKLVYAIISTCTSNETKTCYATNFYVAKCICSDVSTVKRSIIKLIKYNYIVKFIKNNNKRYIRTTISKFIKDRENLPDSIAELDSEYDWLDELD